jgi:hypothetical protein
MPSYRALRIRLSGRKIEKRVREREREQEEEGVVVVFDIDSISSIHLSDKLFSSSSSLCSLLPNIDKKKGRK